MLKFGFKRRTAVLLILTVLLSVPAGMCCYAVDELEQHEMTEIEPLNEISEPESESYLESESLSEEQSETEQKPEQEPESDVKPETESEHEQEESEQEEESEPEPGLKSDIDPKPTTTLTVSITWIDGDNYYGHRPQSVNFTVQRRLDPGALDADAENGWEDCPATMETFIPLDAGCGWSRTIYNLPALNENDYPYQYRAVESVFNFPQGSVPVEAYYEYRHYEINSYDDTGNVKTFRTRCTNAIRIYSVPTGDSFNLWSLHTLCVVSVLLPITGAVYIMFKKKEIRR